MNAWQTGGGSMAISQSDGALLQTSLVDTPSVISSVHRKPRRKSSGGKLPSSKGEILFYRRRTTRTPSFCSAPG
nr:MAG TPA: hypothetical protein [Caudoviricetes sp.]